MWKLGVTKQMFLVVGLIGILVFAAPSLALLFNGSGGEKFSELYILGPGHMAEDYPFNVAAGVSCLVYLGMVNHLGSSVYYGVQVKLRNSTEMLPNATVGVPSPLPALYEFQGFAVDGQALEKPLFFEFSDVISGANVSHVGRITINNATYDVNKSLQWDAENNGYYCEIFVELWVYDLSSSGFQFHNRFVGLWLNITAVA
jgi:hypothetical protein